MEIKIDIIRYLLRKAVTATDREELRKTVGAIKMRYLQLSDTAQKKIYPEISSFIQNKELPSPFTPKPRIAADYRKLLTKQQIKREESKVTKLNDLLLTLPNSENNVDDHPVKKFIQKRISKKLQKLTTLNDTLTNLNN
jgi:hypothetical protein